MKTLFLKLIIPSLFFTLVSISMYAQEATNNSKEYRDSIFEKNNAKISYDVENIKVSEIKYTSSDKIEYKKYYSRDGKDISNYTWKINIHTITKIQHRIKELFNYNDQTACTGTSVLLLLIDIENNIYEIRVTKGITDEFNKELLRVLEILEKDLIYIGAEASPQAIITSFPFSLKTKEERPK